MLLVYIIISVVIFVLTPQDAFAWGPGFHLEIALNAIEKYALFAPAIGALIKAYPKFFIYGAVSADITVGKKYAGLLHHCHNWNVGKMILKEAKSDAERAAAYGYLTHLAADVVAHNYYIPYKIIKSYSARFINHTYWEMRFDLSVTPKIWKHIGDIINDDFTEFDRLMERVLKKTLFSFRTNKKIFSSIVVLQKMSVMRKTLGVYAKKSRWTLVGEDVKNYRGLTYESVDDFLTHPDKAMCLNVDPAGIERLEYAKDLRKRLKKSVKRKTITKKDAISLIHEVKKELRKSVYISNAQLPDAIDIL